MFTQLIVSFKVETEVWEYGMCTMILGEARSLEGLLGLMIHEGSHSWFPVQMFLPTKSTKPWLDEGFTSYAESYDVSTFPKRKRTKSFLSEA